MPIHRTKPELNDLRRDLELYAAAWRHRPIRNVQLFFNVPFQPEIYHVAFRFGLIEHIRPEFLEIQMMYQVQLPQEELLLKDSSWLEYWEGKAFIDHFTRRERGWGVHPSSLKKITLRIEADVLHRERIDRLVIPRFQTHTFELEDGKLLKPERDVEPLSTFWEGAWPDGSIRVWYNVCFQYRPT